MGLGVLCEYKVHGREVVEDVLQLAWHCIAFLSPFFLVTGFCVVDWSVLLHLLQVPTEHRAPFGSTPFLARQIAIVLKR